MSLSDPCPHGTSHYNCRTCSGFYEHRSVSWIRSVGEDLPIAVDIDGKITCFDVEQNDISKINAINSDDMKQHLPEIDPNVLAEHQAQQEWEERKALVDQVRSMFLSLTTELKREVLKDVCMYCLRVSRERCHCENDE